MTFAQLTPEQQTAVINFVDAVLRPAIGLMTQLITKGSITSKLGAVQSAYAAVLGPMDALDENALIDATSPLLTKLTAAEVRAFMALVAAGNSQLQQMAAQFNTPANLALASKATGV